jgi:hypothetical protein
MLVTYSGSDQDAGSTVCGSNHLNALCWSFVAKYSTIVGSMTSIILKEVALVFLLACHGNTL